ncbi:condensation domain-containing protein [Nocardia takedensis]|uniref:condensation domain-containing protein n=1 Tax=Nocardia takedensis TaxID=259390 RepID=UPI0002E25CBD
MVTTIAGVLDTARLVKAVSAFVRTHDGLRTWFDRADTAPVRRIVAPEAVAFEAVPLPDPAPTGWTDALLRHFESAVSPFEWPGACFAAIPREHDFELVFVADHAFSDGISQAMAAAELTARYHGTNPATVSGDDNADYALREHERADDSLADALYPYWEHALGRTGFRLPGAPIDLGVPEGSRHRRSLRRTELLATTAADSFDRCVAASGATMAAGVFTALALTEFELTGRERFWTLNVASVRHGRRFATSQGWFCNFVPMTFPLGEQPTFLGTLAAAHRAVVHTRRMSRLPAHAALGRLMASGRGAELVTREPYFVTVLDLRHGTRSAANDPDTRLFTADTDTSTVSIWVGRDDTRYPLGLGAPDVAVATERLADYTDRLCRIMAAIAVTGDYTAEAPAADPVHP